MYNSAELLYSMYNATWSYSRANNSEWRYNYASSKYNAKDYTWALRIFVKEADSNHVNDELQFRTYHNVWNTFFRIYEWKKEKDEKIDLLQKAKDSYTDALGVRIDKETQKNLEYVEYLLEELQENSKSEWWDSTDIDSQQMQEKQSNETSKSEKSEEGAKKEEDEKWETTWEKQEEWAKEKWENMKAWWTEDWDSDKEGEWWNSWEQEEISDMSKDWDEVAKQTNDPWNTPNWLSEETRKLLDEHSKQLEQEQWDIWKYYNKNYSENNDPLEEFSNFFSWDPFFDNSAINWNSSEKDW